MRFLHETLANGLEVVAECSEGALSTSVGFFVGAGARDETDALAGVSHFLEHMTFKGTADLSADEINRRFDQMGARTRSQARKTRSTTPRFSPSSSMTPSTCSRG